MDVQVEESFDAAGLTAQWVGAHAGVHAPPATPALMRRDRYQDIASSSGSDDNDDDDEDDEHAPSSCLQPAASGLHSLGADAQAALAEAAEAFPHAFGPAWTGAIDSATVQEVFRLPKAQVYGLLDVLEVLEVRPCVPAAAHFRAAAPDCRTAIAGGGMPSTSLTHRR